MSIYKNSLKLSGGGDMSFYSTPESLPALLSCLVLDH